MRRHLQRVSGSMITRGRRQWNNDDASVILLWKRHVQSAWLTGKVDAANNYMSTTTTKTSPLSKMTTPLLQVVDEMRQHLSSDPSPHQKDGWNKAWEERLTPWDLGGPTPALVSELAKDWNRNRRWWEDRRSLRTLVPGCGAGYDLTTIANHHDQVVSTSNNNDIQESVVVGLDIAPLSLERAKSVLNKSDTEGATDHDHGVSNTQIELVIGNFFDRSSWETFASMPRANPQVQLRAATDDIPFDLVFDYTFFCALPPTLRTAWGEQVSALLHPNHGRLLTFIFPITPDAEMIGPPYPVTVADYQQVLHPWGWELDYDGPYESNDTVPKRKGKELVAWWKRRAGP